MENARPISLLCYNECVCPLADSVSVEDPLEPWTPPPQYLPSPTDITVRAGDRAVLPCGIQNLGTKQVTLSTVSLVLHALGIQNLGTKQVTLSTISLVLHALGIQILGTKQVTLSTVSLVLQAFWHIELGN